MDEWRIRIRSRSNPDRVPFTLVAYLDSEPSGSVSVCEDNGDERFADGGPWLTGMFVVGPARNLSVGRELVRVAEDTARRFGASELRLHTAEAGPFYERCGWSYLHRKGRPSDQSVMRREL
jgi:GNAT superfamily N-acetyltransferase